MLLTHPSILSIALAEDLAQGDLTVDHLPLLNESISVAYLRNRSEMVISGLDVAQEVFMLVDTDLHFEAFCKNSDKLPPNSNLAKITGNTASLLKAERTALNFMQHLSGIATLTRQYADALTGTNSVVTHTRKTTPGLRTLERQAVLHGGGVLHRYNLGSAVMLKDNHLTQISIQEAVHTLRQKVGHTVSIEVEADTLEQVQAALDAGADIIMLDNMTPEQVKTANTMIRNNAKIEASGNISLETIRTYAEAGAQFISTSKITLGAPAVDIGLDFETA